MLHARWKRLHLTATRVELSQLMLVEEKFGEQNFRVLSEMRILGKIKVAILDFVG